MKGLYQIYEFDSYYEQSIKVISDIDGIKLESRELDEEPQPAPQRIFLAIEDAQKLIFAIQKAIEHKIGEQDDHIGD